MLLPAEWLEFLLTSSRTLTALTVISFPVALICVGREIFNSRSAQGSIAWILTLLLLPFPTILLYFALGWKQFDDYAAAQRYMGRESRQDRSRELAVTDKTASQHWLLLSRVSQLPFLSGNEAELLIDGAETFASMFDGIAQAQDYVLVQFYIFRDDALGHELADRLIERVRAGVSVHVLYDEVGCRPYPRSVFERMRQAGIPVAGFNQQHKWLRLYGPMRINYRNHRKVVVVDGATAWVGGHNVGKEYLGEDPRFGYWRDTHVRVAGPAALACALIFREDWYWATGERLVAAAPPDPQMRGGQSVLVMPTGPADALEGCSIAFTDVIARARRRLWIVSPYFVPGRETQTALYAAALRGVDVRILLPERPDHRLVWLASHAHADDMFRRGINVYRYTRGFLHQKVILADDQIAGIGTVNFDNRSFSINFELTLWFNHPEMIAEIGRMLEADFRDARLTTSAELRHRSFPFRLAAHLARLFSPLL